MEEGNESGLERWAQIVGEHCRMAATHSPGLQILNSPSCPVRREQLDVEAPNRLPAIALLPDPAHLAANPVRLFQVLLEVALKRPLPTEPGAQIL